MPVLDDRRVGGSSGIGLATAELLTARGAKVTIGGRDPERLKQAAASVADVVAVSVAGGVTAIGVDAGDLGSLREFYAQAGPLDDLMLTVTRCGGAGPGALEAAVPVLARELAPRRVNAVSPGVIQTAWWDELSADERSAAFASFAERTPVGRNGTPGEVAAAIAALLENGFITGVVLPCDGGLRLT